MSSLLPPPQQNNSRSKQGAGGGAPCKAQARANLGQKGRAVAPPPQQQGQQQKQCKCARVVPLRLILSFPRPSEALSVLRVQLYVSYEGAPLPVARTPTASHLNMQYGVNERNMARMTIAEYSWFSLDDE